MKKIIILLVLALLTVLSITSCEVIDKLIPHIHSYEEGVCQDCGELDSDYFSEGLFFFANGNGTCSVGISHNCTDTDIVIPPVSNKGKVVAIGDKAFHSHTNLRSVVIPDGVTEIGDYAFSKCASLTSIELPDSVKKLGKEPFWGCESLTSIKIPEGVSVINEYSFSKCASLTNVELPSTLKEIRNGAFWGCASMTSIKIPEGVNKIDHYAFSNCSSLASIEIPASVTFIGDIFYNCTSLTNITYNGTIEQLYSLEAEIDLSQIPATYIQCSDGIIPLD